jgi:chromosome segregation ATPase
VEITDVTTIRRPRLAERLTRSLRERSGPPSLRAQLVLIVAAILLGAVLSGFLFVGVWRHTAAESDTAKAAQAATSRDLRAARARLATTDTELAAAEAALAHSRTQTNSLRHALAAARRANARADAALASPLAAVVANGAAVQHQLAKLHSELSTIGTYLGNATATGVDPAFVEAQVRYLTTSASAAEHAAASVSRQAALAQDATKHLGH